MTHSTEVKMYTVPITGDIAATLDSYVKVYAVSPDEAVAKVQAQIDAQQDAQEQRGLPGEVIGCPTWTIPSSGA